MDILTGAGEIVTATPDNEHADLFHGFPNSYGSLGYATRLRIELEPVQAIRRPAPPPLPRPRRALRGHRRRSSTREHDGEPVDYLDGVVFTRDEAYLTLGSRSTSRRPADRAAERLHRPADLLPLDPARRRRARSATCSRPTTTSGAGTPTGSGARARSVPRTRACAGSGRAAGAGPASTGSSSPSTSGSASPTGSRPARATRRGSGSSRTSRSRSSTPPSSSTGSSTRCRSSRSGCARCVFAATRRGTSTRCGPTETYVNVGFWSTVPRRASPVRPTGPSSAASASSTGTSPSTPTPSTPASEFDALYGGDGYAALKASHDPHGRFPHLYDKAVRHA